MPATTGEAAPRVLIIGLPNQVGHGSVIYDEWGHVRWGSGQPAVQRGSRTQQRSLAYPDHLSSRTGLRGGSHAERQTLLGSLEPHVERFDHPSPRRTDVLGTVGTPLHSDQLVVEDGRSDLAGLPGYGAEHTP